MLVNDTNELMILALQLVEISSNSLKLHHCRETRCVEMQSNTQTLILILLFSFASAPVTVKT